MKSRRRCLVAVLLVALFAAKVLGQDETNQQGDLILETIEVDIRTASYYELVAWAERLDLSTRGSRAELQKRLRDHYGVTAAEPARADTTGSRPITIESANSTEYYTLEGTEEHYLELHGNVILTMRDEKTDSVHTIEADRIVYNQDRNELTASGNLVYTLESPDKTEVFRGDSLSFSLDDWVGEFSNGTSTVDREYDENTVTFFYSGETIYRLADDIILLDSGTITSSDPEDPYYRIDASGIKILAPQEWALENAVLYVGHVPMFYFPFFFHPGDELFMHPSIGFDDVRGYFIKTTTYLIGQKRDSTGSLSFLRVSEETSGSYDTKLEGLFLRKTTKDKSQTDATEAPAAAQDEDYLKLLADLYSRQGFFLGVAGSLTGSSVFKKFDMLFGIARTRNIYAVDVGGYSYLDRTSEDTFESVWNTGALLNTELPFRYGGSMSLGIGNRSFNVDLSLAQHSDPFVSRDFFVREEEIDWARLLGIKQTDTETDAATGGKRTDTFQWKLATRLTPQLPGLAPYVQTAQINRFDLSLTWRAKTRPDEDLGNPDTYEPLGFLYPDRYFFVPENMSTPSAAARVSGTLFRHTFGGSSSQPASQKRPAEEGPALRPPWAISSDEEQKQTEKTTPSLRVPEPIDATAVPRKQTAPFYDHQLTYSVTPETTVDTRFNTNAWERPEDIVLFEDQSNEYTLLSTKANAQMSYRGTVYRSSLTLNEAVTAQGTLREHIDPLDPESDAWQRLVDQDRNTTLFRTSNTLGLIVKPLFFLPSWADTSVNYDLASTVFQRIFDTDVDEYVNQWAEWETDFITTHTLTLTGRYKPPIGAQSLATTFTLPPADPVIDIKGIFVTSWLTTTSTVGFETIDEEWQWKPFTLTERLAPDIPAVSGSYIESGFTYDPEEKEFGESTSDLLFRMLDGDLSFRQTFKYDLAEKNPLESVSTFHAAFFDAGFSAKRAKPIEFLPASGWRTVPDSEEEFLPSLATFAVKYVLDEQRFWRNRIALSGNVTSAWNLNLVRVTDSTLSLDIKVQLSIAEFLDLSLSSRSEQRGSYRYIPALSEKVGLPWLNPVSDIAKSLNFFNRKDRVESDFNLSSITLEAVHYLRDWELTVSYGGKPIISTESGSDRYIWDSSFSIFVRWYPIPEIKREVTYADSELGI